jgi:hypothetical protein
MRAPVETNIGGRVYTVTPMTPTATLRMTPTMLKGLDGMTPDEIERFKDAMLSNALVDGRPMFPKARFDAEMDGRMVDLMGLLRFATEVNWAGPTDAAGPGAAAEGPSAT